MKIVKQIINQVIEELNENGTLLVVPMNDWTDQQTLLEAAQRVDTDAQRMLESGHVSLEPMGDKT